MKNLLATMICLLLVSVLFAQEKNVSKTYQNIRSIEIETASGDIRFKKASGSDVKVDLSHNYDEDEYTASFEQNGDELSISEKFSRGSHSGSAKWVLEIPDNIKIKVNTGSGDVTLSDLTMRLKLNLGSGDVELNAMKGELSLNTGSGNIEGDNFDGELSLNTGSGDIRLSDSKGDLSLNAGSGTISLDRVSGGIEANTGSGDIKGNTITVTGNSKFNTGSGDANITLAKALDYSIAVNSGSGDATLNFNGSQISGEVVMVANKRNGKIVAPFKFDKEETIDNGGSDDMIQKTAKLGTKDIRIKVSTGSGTATIGK